MIHILTIISLFDRYIIQLVAVMLALYTIYIVGMTTCSAYHRHNRAVRNSIRQLRATVASGKIVPFVNSIPAEYRAQWHCYTTAHSAPAISMFSPLPRKSAFRWGLLPITCIVLWHILVAVYVIYNSNSIALYSMCSGVALVIPTILLVRWIASRQYAGACRLFGKYVALIQAYYGNGDLSVPQPANPVDVEYLVQQLRLIGRCAKEDQPAKVASVLNSQPQNIERTVAQQRRINNVLNDLLITAEA